MYRFSIYHLHFTFDLEEHLKDSINKIAITIQISE